MHDAGKVLAGLVVFLAIATSPMWYHAASGADAKPPELSISAASQQCLAPTEYMRAFHMDMLDAWRDEAVRTSDTTYVGLDGKSYEKNLAGTCLGECHADKDQFCDRCHEYVGAEP
ncbi:MAG: cytochrome C, partial [Gammaproteobacteria bacterium]|nr:cytochrome C [Gammaproteobacteria bacterium]